MKDYEPHVMERLHRKLGGRWTLEEVLGVGGMAAVYGARDEQGTRAALKILHPDMNARGTVRQRFLREAYVANRIDHPGVVRILDHGKADDGTPFLVMERLVGESFSERLARHGTLPETEVLDLLSQTLGVLEVAHAHDVIHRDLKPDNLFRTDDGAVKVLDFGVARVLEGAGDDVRTQTGVALGTLPYMAPEQAMGRREEIDGRVDLFALGATAFRMLTGRRIHEADSQAALVVAIATQPAPRLRSLAPDVSEGLGAVVDQALAFTREARYPSATDMLRDVEALARGESPPFVGARAASCDAPTRQTNALPAGVAANSAAGPVASTPAVAPSVEVGAPAWRRRRRLVIGVGALATLVGALLAWGLAATLRDDDKPRSAIAAERANISSAESVTSETEEGDGTGGEAAAASQPSDASPLEREGQSDAGGVAPPSGSGSPSQSLSESIAANDGGQTRPAEELVTPPPPDKRPLRRRKKGSKKKRTKGKPHDR